jgi:hypothetical protein
MDGSGGLKKITKDADQKAQTMPMTLSELSLPMVFQ